MGIDPIKRRDRLNKPPLKTINDEGAKINRDSLRRDQKVGWPSAHLPPTVMHFAIITTIPRPIAAIGFHQGGAVMGISPDRPTIFAVSIVL